MPAQAGSFLSVAEVAGELGVSRSTVLRLFGQREVKAMRLGGQIKIPYSEMIRLKRALSDERLNALSVEDVAQKLGVPRQRVKELIRSGELDAKERLVGRGVVIWPEDYERFTKAKIDETMAGA